MTRLAILHALSLQPDPYVPSVFACILHLVKTSKIIVFCFHSGSPVLTVEAVSVVPRLQIEMFQLLLYTIQCELCRCCW